MLAPFAGEVCFHNEDSPSFYWGNDAEFKCYLCQEVNMLLQKLMNAISGIDAKVRWYM